MYRRLSSLKNQSRSNSFSLNFGKMNEKLICFPILSDNIPGRRESSDWNDFIQLGMQEDGNPIRSLRRSRAGKSSLGENSRLETTWNSTITPIQDTTNSLPIQSSSNSNLISPRRNSNRLLSLGGPQANTGRSIYDLASSIVPTINATLKAAAGLELPNKKIKKLKVVEQLKEEGNETMKEEKKISVKKAKKPEGYVGRPPNAWILYRSEQIRILKTDNAKIKKPQSDIC